MRERTVLIVEDDPDSRYILERYLSHHGFRTLLAASGEEGLLLARREKPDAILMDISIPGMDGWETSRRLREEPETASIPVIAVTAHAFPDDRRRAQEVGLHGFLAKPCEPERILAELRRIVEPIDS